jgi:glycosyltransferase involved in cell wall biosynthesis
MMQEPAFPIDGDTVYDGNVAEASPPCVMQVLPALVTGGVERGTVEIAQALIEQGWMSIVVSSGGPMVRELARAGAMHVELPVDSKNPLTMRRNVGRLERLIANYGVNLVHARSRAPAWSAQAAARRAGCHFVTTFHGTYNLGLGGIKRAYNAVMTRGERVIAISEFIADHLQQNYQVPRDRIRVVPRGVDLARFDPARVSAERIIQLARAWRLPDGCPVIMLPGRLTRWKGQRVLIEAIAALGRKDIRCLLVGSEQGRAGYRDELLSLVGQLGLREVVHIVGDCSDMPAAYMLADVVVSASTDAEAFGRTIVEAQAMGRPVVAADHGGARETVLNGQTGFLTQPGNVKGLAEGIASVLRMDSQAREDLATAAITHVRTNFSQDTMCARELEVYREILGMTTQAAPEPEAEPEAEAEAPPAA